MQSGEAIGHFSRSLAHRYSASQRAAMTSQVLTNLVFLVRRKDQPLDKSVFIRKEEKPSSIYQPCLGHYSLSFSPKPAFLSTNIRHPSWVVSLIAFRWRIKVRKLHANSPSRWLIKRVKGLVFRFVRGIPKSCTVYRINISTITKSSYKEIYKKLF